MVRVTSAMLISATITTRRTVQNFVAISISYHPVN